MTLRVCVSWAQTRNWNLSYRITEEILTKDQWFRDTISPASILALKGHKSLLPNYGAFTYHQIAK